MKFEWVFNVKQNNNNNNGGDWRRFIDEESNMIEPAHKNGNGNKFASIDVTNYYGSRRI